MKRKNRKEKALEYEQNFGFIPKDNEERLSWMIDKYNLSEQKMQSILNKRDLMMNSMYYTNLIVILYELPEGSPRPRFRLVNRKNLINEAMSNSNFVHVYSINAHEDSVYMKRIVDDELYGIEQMIHTPCIIEYDTFIKTPSAFNTEDVFLSELGIIRPIVKPDWDNIGKKYSDMYNRNVWLDDTLVISGTVNKYYSILPRIEIKLKYLNTVYNKYQYNSLVKKLDNDIKYIFK